MAYNEHNGLLTEYHSNGKVRLVREFSDGVRHGKTERYYSTGQKEMEGHYIMGREYGEWKYYGARW
jgi:antitoxin component YwqK of YwqJK toxin-antitoxin module